MSVIQLVSNFNKIVNTTTFLKLFQLLIDNILLIKLL
jgi:hypothetical protein